MKSAAGIPDGRKAGERARATSRSSMVRPCQFGITAGKTGLTEAGAIEIDEVS